MVGDQRQGWAIFAVMGILFLVGRHDRLLGRVARAIRPSPRSMSTRRRARLQAGGNMEGKEVRFGIANSALFTTVTTDASCGAVNTMHDSLHAARRHGADGQHHARRDHLRRRRLRPLRHAAFAIVAMFVAGLMVGRTPEYLGKKLEAKEVKMAILAILILPLSILGFTALAVVLPAGLAGHRQCRAARLQRDPLRLSPRRPATTAAPSPASPPTRRSRTRRSASRC